MTSYDYIPSYSIIFHSEIITIHDGKIHGRPGPSQGIWSCGSRWPSVWPSRNVRRSRYGAIEAKGVFSLDEELSYAAMQ